MSRTKKRAARQSPPSLRPYAETPRHRFLHTDVTKTELKKIQQHCRERQISVSHFLAELMLQDAEDGLEAPDKPKERISVRVEFDLTPDEFGKLQLLARLHEKESISQFVRQILQPHLHIRRLHAPVETTAIRYYLSESEHAKVLKNVARRGISARNYAAILALRALEMS